MQSDAASQKDTQHSGDYAHDKPSPRRLNGDIPELSRDEHDTAHLTSEDMHIAGVKRIEAISGALGKWGKISAFFGIFVLAYSYSLDSSMRYTLQGYATASFGQHSLLTTLGVLSGVIGAAAQPVAAKIADAVGRVELLCVALFFYAIGTVVEATSNGVSSYAGGVVLYQLGYTMITILVAIMIADMSSLRARLFLSFIPPSPWLINSWIGSYILAGFTNTIPAKWRVGIGMWAAITPFAGLLVIVTLLIAQRRAKRVGALANYSTPFQSMGWRLIPHLFWQLDIIGALLTVAFIALILMPLTLAKGSSDTWKEARTIAPIVIGICLVPVWVFWERTCAHPLVPFHLLRDRGVWAGLGIAALLNAAWYVQGAYVYPMLIVAFDRTVLQAGYITNIFTFCSTFTGMCLGLVVVRVQRLKPFIVVGSILYTLSFGLLIRYRGGQHGSAVAGIVAAEVLLGIGAGFFSYPAITSVQARTKHVHVAVVTGLYFAIYNLGGAFGNVISGAVWTQRMPGELASRLTNQTLAAEVFASPYTAIIPYPYGTPERQAMVESYMAVQYILGIIGICLCIPLIIFALLLRDTPLGDKQSNENAEEVEEDTHNLTLWQKIWR